MTNDMRTLINDAILEHQQNNLVLAKSLYEKILSIEPDHSDANHNLGVLLASLGQTLEASEHFARALESNQAITQFWKSYIDNLRSLSDLEKLKSLKSRFQISQLDAAEQVIINELFESAFSSAIEANFVQKSRDLYQSGNFQECVGLTEEHALMGLLNAEILNIRGASYIELKKYRHAIDEFLAAVEKRPDIPELYFNIGNAQRELKQFELAIKYYLKSLELNSAYVAAMQNLGIAYTQSEKYDLAHKYLKKAIQIAPNSSGVLNAIANVYQNQEDFRKAIEFYLKALRLERTKPDFHLNLAISLEGLKKNFLASQIYQRCIHLNPQYTPCINNYAYLCHRNGDTERAIDFYIRSLRISDQQFEAWNNIYFPLLTDKILNHRKDSEIENLLGAELKAKQPIEYQLLMHRLSNDTEQKVSFEKLKECIFSSQKYAVASKRKYKNKTVDLTAEKQITALLHFGRSGSGLLHSLIDGHPQIQTLPSVYFSEFFDRFSWQELLRDGPENVARKFVDMYPVFFDSRSKEAAFAQSMTQHKRFGEIEGLTKLGETADEYLWLDEKRFQMILQCFLDEETTITPRSVFQAVHAAFAEVAGFFNFDKNIFYHIHNPSPFALANYVSQFPNGKLVLIVRDPIQSCESWVIKVSDNREKIISRIVKMLSDVDNYVFQVVPSVGVRLEDVKRTPSETLSGLSRWMNIEYNEETMFEMTMMGKKWWGDPVSPDYKRDGMNPFGQISINRAKSSFFGDHDVRVLETLFYPFNVKFGYRNRDDEWFRDSLAYCEKNIGRLFEFEMRFASKMKISEQDLKLDGPYKYFRAKLIQKLRRLRENDDCHHNVITPLKS